MGCSDHVWQCPGHKWRPNITLVEPSLGLNFSMQFMDEADGAACVVVYLLSGGVWELLGSAAVRRRELVLMNIAPDNT